MWLTHCWKLFDWLFGWFGHESRACTGRATPLPSESQDDALRTVGLLGLGGQRKNRTPQWDRRNGEGELGAAAAATTVTVGGVTREGGERPGECSEERSEERSQDRSSEGMKALLERGQGPDSTWRDGRGVGGRDDSAASGVGGGDNEGPANDGGDPGWRYFAGRMGREEAEALLRCEKEKMKIKMKTKKIMLLV